MRTKRDALPHGTLDLLVLRTLARGSQHGYGIVAHVQNASDQLLRVEEGSLYPALHRLEQAGMLRAEWRPTENNRRAKFYTLTPQGRRQLVEEQRTWKLMTEGVSKVLGIA